MDEKSPRTRQQWVAYEFHQFDRLQRREYKLLTPGGVDLGEAFGFQNVNRTVGNPEHITTLQAPPPRYAVLRADLGSFYATYPSPQVILWGLHGTLEEAEVEADRDREGWGSDDGDRVFMVVEVDHDGFPLQSEIDELRPVLLELKEKLDRELTTKRRRRRAASQKRREEREAAQRINRKEVDE